MTVIDEPAGVSTSEISDELIFLIASVASDDQRKRTTELFRHFARRVALEAFALGQKSVLGQTRAAAAFSDDALRHGDALPSAAQSNDSSDDLCDEPVGDPVRQIPAVRWLD